MFSIRINDVGLNDAAITDNIKQLLRKNISNGIRKLAEVFCPANT